MSTSFNFCPSCGAPTTEGIKFCGSCGFELLAATGAGTGPPEAGRAGPRHRSVEEEVEDLLRSSLSNDYEIKGLLGKGGMAIVYSAHEKELERDVAIKVLPPDMAFGSGTVERFKREARTAAALNHPNIIPIYRIGEVGRTVYFVMKHIRGRGLDDLLVEFGRFDQNVTVSILKQACSALSYAHRKNVIHRDIKPSNIMVDDDGWAHVMDFGIAKATGSSTLTATGAAIGTPQYMSPEQCSGKDITPLSDQYSLGIMTFQMLTGIVPFQGETIPEIISQHFFEPPPDIRGLIPNCPEGVKAAIEKSLSKSPSDRFENLDAFLKALEEGTHDLDLARTQVGKMATRLGPAIATPLNPSPMPDSKSLRDMAPPSISEERRSEAAAQTTPMPESMRSAEVPTSVAPPRPYTEALTPATPLPESSTKSDAPKKSRKGLIAAAGIVVLIGGAGGAFAVGGGFGSDASSNAEEQTTPQELALNQGAANDAEQAALDTIVDEQATTQQPPSGGDVESVEDPEPDPPPPAPPSRITLTNVPSGATVRVNGRRQSNWTRLEVNPGRVDVSIAAPGYRDFDQRFTVGEGETVRIPVSMRLIPPPPDPEPEEAEITPPAAIAAEQPAYCGMDPGIARATLPAGKYAIVLTGACVPGIRMFVYPDREPVDNETFTFDVPSNGLVRRIRIEAPGYRPIQELSVRVSAGQVLEFSGELVRQ